MPPAAAAAAAATTPAATAALPLIAAVLEPCCEACACYHSCRHSYAVAAVAFCSLMLYSSAPVGLTSLSMVRAACTMPVYCTLRPSCTVSRPRTCTHKESADGQQTRCEQHYGTTAPPAAPPTCTLCTALLHAVLLTFASTISVAWRLALCIPQLQVHSISLHPRAIKVPLDITPAV